MQSTAPGGIRIEAPGGTAIIITPNFWPDRQLWYMNIDVRRPRATEGVMGAIAPGSWLPALPDGTSLGQKPGDLHQRYVDLYEKFESAWRVTNSTTLFDYAPGTSTSTFTIESWPIENPQSCMLPRFPEGPAPRPPGPGGAGGAHSTTGPPACTGPRKRERRRGSSLPGAASSAQTLRGSEAVHYSTRPRPATVTFVLPQGLFILVV